jgi:hypothetical protein
VARVLRGHWLPSDWATRRLLRFMAGLAMLAMAFTGPAAAAPAPSPTVITTSSAATPVTLNESVSAPAAVRVEAVTVPAEARVVLPVAALVTVLTGAGLRIRGRRAPPAA